MKDMEAGFEGKDCWNCKIMDVYHNCTVTYLLDSQMQGVDPVFWRASHTLTWLTDDLCTDFKLL